MLEQSIKSAGSLKGTLWLFALLALAISFYITTDASSEWLLTVPLLLLSLNLLAAITTRPIFRRQMPLLSFHLALLAVVVLVAIGRVTSLQGEAEVTVGESFRGELSRQQSGYFHHWKLDQVQFTLQGFSINYAPGLNREETRTTLTWKDEEGRNQSGVIGDHHPLRLHGYRFYTTHNKGFAPTFSWQAAGQPAQRGSIHLPGYPGNAFRQALEWSLPGVTQQLWTELQFDEVIIDPDNHWAFRKPQQHTLVFRIGNDRYELSPGDSIELPEGQLRYEELGTWMGFKVSADWTLPWLIAASFLAVVCLGWHYSRKYRRNPWQDDSTDDTLHSPPLVTKPQ